MKVIIKVDVGDDVRRAILHSLGGRGRAKRSDVRTFCWRSIAAAIAEARRTYATDPEVRRRRARKLNALGPGLGMRGA